MKYVKKLSPEQRVEQAKRANAARLAKRQKMKHAFKMYQSQERTYEFKNTKKGLKQIGTIGLYERDGETKLSLKRPNREEHETGWSFISMWDQYKNV